jgi:tRNA-Thr(GGU) m(6)t(6)A37 methyltransferase TsaA
MEETARCQRKKKGFRLILFPFVILIFVSPILNCAPQNPKGQDMTETSYTIKPIGFISSELASREAAPHQGYEGAPDAWLIVNSTVSEGIEGIVAGSEVILITWFHKAQRDILKLHPRGDKNIPLTGVFATRSADRPNPLGLHRVTVREIAGNRLKVGPIEAIDGTPVVDIKPVLTQSADS